MYVFYPHEIAVIFAEKQFAKKIGQPTQKKVTLWISNISKV